MIRWILHNHQLVAPPSSVLHTGRRSPARDRRRQLRSTCTLGRGQASDRRERQRPSPLYLPVLPPQRSMPSGQSSVVSRSRRARSGSLPSARYQRRSSCDSSRRALPRSP